MSKSPVPVAIVGMSALLPGAPDLQTYWRNIVDAVDCLTDIPDDHSWSPKDYYDADPRTPDKTWATRGGFIDKVPFDPMQHGVIPVALEAIDTDQLIALIVARECLRDAGLDPDGDGWNRDRTSVILGHTSTNELVVDLSARLHGPTWRKAMARQGVPEGVIDKVVEDIARFFPTWQEQSFPGMLANVAAGRIANRLDLGGTNATVDAACASSLGALHYAISELQAGRTDLALSGGTDTLNDIFMYMCFSKTPALSKKGDARPFSSDSDGIVISEGVALFALKRLPDAERDGDRIYAVIKGIGTSSDGRNKSIYAPASSGQVKAVHRAYDEAGFDLESVELIEAHGTGTKAGDLAEFNGLRTIFEDDTTGETHVAMGSVKSQIGHTKATAGAAGLMKVALALHQKVLPPTAKITAPNPKMQFEGTPLYLNTQARPWVHAGNAPRRAGVSAFGFGGTNYHFAVEEYAEGAEVVSLPAQEHLFLVAAADADALIARIDHLAETTAKVPTIAHAARAVLQDWAPDAQVIAFTAGTADALTRAWTTARALIAEGTPTTRDGVRFGIPTADDARTAVVFPGQGSQYIDMLRTAALRHPALRQTLDAAEQALRDAGRGSLASRIFPPPAWSPEAEKAQKAALTATEWAQPALGAVEAGLWSTLSGFGVTAEAFAGHSYGELVALWAAGAYDLDTLWTLSRVRGEAMAGDGQDRGTMAAVRGDVDEVATIIDGLDDVVLANRNHPKQAVIAGSREGIDRAIQVLSDADLSAMPIPVSAAFHSPLVADAAAPLAEALASARIEAPRTPVWADVTAAPYAADADAVRELLTAQITAQVDWVGIVRGLVEQGVRTFVECGPKGVLSKLINKTAGSVDGLEVIAVDGDAGRTDGDVAIKRLLAALACRGVAIDVAPLLAERLPAVPMQAGSAATVWVGGPNVKRPETLQPPAPAEPAWTPPAAIEAPRIERARVHADGSVDAPIKRRKPSPVPTTDTAGPPLFTAGAHDSDGGRPSGRSTPPSKAPDSTSTAPGLSGDALSSLLDATRASLQAFQETQAKTAEVHAEFLKGHQKATESFTALFEHHGRMVERLAGGEVSPATLSALSTAPAPAVPRAPGPAFTPPAAPQVAATHEALTDAIVRPTGPQRATTLEMPTNDGPAVRGSDDLPPVLSARQLSEAVKRGDALPGVTRGAPVPPAPAAAPAAPSVDVRGVLLATIADRTGYPADLLEDGMDLESDLGVDSIKRVEIFSALAEAMPEMPALPDDEIAALRTIGDIIARLEQAAPATPAGAVAPRGAAPPAPELPPRKRASVTSTVMGVVADRTGYPEDLLGIAMDLEGDLGIDSIKRVEIFSALADAMPELPALPDDEIAALRTLGDIIDRLEGLLGAAAPSPAAPQPAPTPSVDAAAVLRQVVADRTGYPADLLQDDMDLEGDLGIDSIKRVEILSALQEAVPGLPDLDEDALARARTLADIAALMTQALGGGSVTEAAPTGTASPPAATPTPGHAPPRREVVVAPAPDGEAVVISGPVVVTRDPGGKADALAAALRHHGLQASVIDATDTIPSGTAGVVHMAALGTSGASLTTAVTAGFTLARQASGVELFATITGLGGTFGHETLAGDAAEGALAGLAKTVAQEWPQTRALALDIDPEHADIDSLAEELLTDRGVVEVGLGDETTTLEVVEVALTDDLAGEAPIAEGDLVVVSGGARGVTADVVLEMARRWKPTLLLLGRSAIPDADPAWAEGIADGDLKAARIGVLRKEGAPFEPRRLEREVGVVLKSREIRATLDACDAAGARVTYAVADVTDVQAVHDAISETVATAGPVRGLVHGAGIIEDKLLVEKTPESFERVWATKAGGLDALLAAIDTDQLALAAVFSSVAGRYGNRGQVDYAMANEHITHRLHALRHAGVPHVKAFHWGPWDGGMVTPTLAAAFQARGLSLVGRDAGAAAFCDELERGGPAVEVVIGGPDNPGALIGALASSEADRTLDGQEPVELRGDQVFLSDHRIDGKPVLPFVMALEFMTDAARKAVPDLKVVGQRDVAVLKGVVLDNDGVSLTLHWKPTTPAPGADIALAFELRGAPNKIGLPTVHYRGTVDLGRRAPAGGRFAGSNGLGATAYPHDIREAYDRFLFHGPGFQGIQSIRGMSDHGIVGRLDSSQPKRLGVDRARWNTDPVALDSALQLVGLWVREWKGASALPSYVERYTQIAPFRGAVDVHIEMEPTRTARGRYQATFVDEGGRVVARIDGGQYTAMKGLEDRYRSEG